MLQDGLSNQQIFDKMLGNEKDKLSVPYRRGSRKDWERHSMQPLTQVPSSSQNGKTLETTNEGVETSGRFACPVAVPCDRDHPAL